MGAKRVNSEAGAVAAGHGGEQQPACRLWDGGECHGAAEGNGAQALDAGLGGCGECWRGGPLLRGGAPEAGDGRE